MVPYDDLTSLAVADLPGLLPGASRNYGLGHAFLRHIERCPVLLYVIDLSSADYSSLEQLDQLKAQCHWNKKSGFATSKYFFRLLFFLSIVGDIFWPLRICLFFL
jgi:GTPase involved in cell partitioning and DNA repair